MNGMYWFVAWAITFVVLGYALVLAEKKIRKLEGESN